MKNNETEKIKKMLEILTPEQKEELIKSLQKIILSDETASLSFLARVNDARTMLNVRKGKNSIKLE